MVDNPSLRGEEMPSLPILFQLLYCTAAYQGGGTGDDSPTTLFGYFFILKNLRQNCVFNDNFI